MTTIPRNIHKPIKSFLNEGIALHRRTWTLKCAERLKYTNLNEDAKWNHCESKSVSAFDALSFGSDNGFIGCFAHFRKRICPSVVHTPWVHASVDGFEEMEEKCPRLKLLHHPKSSEWPQFYERRRKIPNGRLFRN